MSSARNRRKGRLGTGRRDWLWVVTFLLVGAAVVFMVVVVLSGASEANEPAIAGIQCESGERLGHHVHTRLAIFIEGEEVPLPGDIGRKRGCLYWLHTHEGEGQQGIIHVEAPSDMGFTLGQFFEIWGEPLSPTKLLDKTADAEREIRAMVGTQVYEGNPATIPLVDDAYIQLEYGPPFRSDAP